MDSGFYTNWVVIVASTGGLKKAVENAVKKVASIPAVDKGPIVADLIMIRGHGK